MKVAVCAIIKDCPAKYLQEWLDWHRFIGVTQFFIYDNGSDIPIVEVITDFTDVHVTLWTGKLQQLNAYNDCINRHKDFDWIAFIDDDEFIIVENGNIQDLLSKQTQSGLGLNWLIFGPEDPARKLEPQIKKCTKHIPFSDTVHTHIKSIVRPSAVKTFPNPHFATYLTGHCVDMIRRPVAGPYTKSPVHQGAWINHYYCKNEKEWAAKMEKGRVDANASYTIDMYNNIRDKATLYSNKAVEIYDKKKFPKVVCMRNEEGGQALIDMITEINKTANTSEMTMIEIGSYAGESTIIFARYFKKVYSIDPFMDNYDVNDPTCKEAGLPLVYLKFKENIAPYANIEHIHKTSDEAVFGFAKESIDFIYIDGCHEYSQVKKDIQNYKPIIKTNGFITGHDYALKEIPGVTKAVNEVLGKPSKVYFEGSWVHTKKEPPKPIALITATGGRQRQIELCAEFMRTQTYVGPVIWIIVDDCVPETTNFIKEDFREDWTIVKVYPFPSWQKGQNTQSRNLQAGIDAVKEFSVSAIFIIEDDDYYTPKYLQVLSTALKGFDACGESDTMYYHVDMQKGYRNANHKHASLFQTCFTENMIPQFETVLKRNLKYIDIDFWKLVPKIQFLKGLDLSIGIKGQPGRAGIGAGHRKSVYENRPNDATNVQMLTLLKLYK